MTMVIIPATYQWPIEFFTATTATLYILSLITGNVSQVDRVWTFLPWIYTTYWTLMPLWPRHRIIPLWPYTPEDVPSYLRDEYSPRALMMLGLVTLWMFRLSYNTWRRGFFNLKEEDYRWGVLRQNVPAWFFQFINLTFIAVIQNIILFLLGVPTHTAVQQPHSGLAPSDILCGALSLITLAIEFIADNQQYSFQKFKHHGLKYNGNEWIGARLRWTEDDAKRGFVTRGLWAWSRHPNFLCEQTFWIIITLVPLLAPGSPNLPTHLPTSSDLTPLYPILPSLVLCILFYSSTLFSESISLGKYPEYKAYQERVAMFVPFLTPIWGSLAMVRGRKSGLDDIVWGKGALSYAQVTGDGKEKAKKQ